MQSLFALHFKTLSYRTFEAKLPLLIVKCHDNLVKCLSVSLSKKCPSPSLSSFSDTKIEGRMSSAGYTHTHTQREREKEREVGKDRKRKHRQTNWLQQSIKIRYMCINFNIFLPIYLVISILLQGHSPLFKNIFLQNQTIRK